ncbi:MAG: hypothetical protein K8R23_11035 [Chthoniobacter sp.]|nr:hypothetical protein [Chthoniobacter sp.]
MSRPPPLRCLGLALLMGGLAVGPMLAQAANGPREETGEPPPAPPVEVASFSGRWVATELGGGTGLVSHTLTIWGDGCYLSEAISGSSAVQRATGQIYTQGDRMTFVKATAASETDTFSLKGGVLTITENETSWGKYRRAGDALLPMPLIVIREESSLAGRWASEEIGGSTADQVPQSVTVTFGADGTFVERALWKGEGVKYRSGHYRTNGTELVLNADTGDGKRSWSYVVEKGQLTLREEGGAWMRLGWMPPAGLVGRWISPATSAKRRALTLRADGSYTMRLARDDGSKESRGGDYKVRSGTLELRIADGPSEELAYELVEGMLVLQDQAGAGFRLKREPDGPQTQPAPTQ